MSDAPNMAERQKELPRGTVLGSRYEVIQKLGEGSFSAVYRVLDKSLDVECAIKVLHMWASLDPKLLERFKREVLYSRRIVHEGCCQVFDFAEYDDVAVLVMELVEGWPLDEVLDRLGLLPLPAAFSLVGQAASSIAVLHKHDIIHRDIKAENMMVTRSGRLKVLDLGMSWSAELSSLTAVGSILGTPAYMAPEFIMGGAPTPQSDVYAFGVLSHLVLGGQLPFRAPDLAKLLALHMGAEPTPLRQLRADVPREVEDLVLRCLSKEAAKRPSSARALEEAWIRILGGPPSAEPACELVAALGVPPAAVEPAPARLPATPDPATPTPGAGGLDSFTKLVLSALEPGADAKRTPGRGKAKKIAELAQEAGDRRTAPAAAWSGPETEPIPVARASQASIEKDSVTEIVDMPSEVVEALRRPAAPVAQQTTILDKPVSAPSVADETLQGRTEKVRAFRPGTERPAEPETGPTESTELRVERRRVRLLAAILGLVGVLTGLVLALVLARQTPQGRALIEAVRRWLDR